MKNRILLLICSVVVFGSGCKNDDDNNNVVLSGYDRMVDKNYRISDLLVEANGVIIQDDRDLLDCELDDIYRYESSGTATTRFGTLRCSSTEPNEEFYFWSLISNDTKLILDYGGPNLIVYNILLNDGNRLVLERYTIEDTDNNGQDESVKTTLTYRRT